MLSFYPAPNANTYTENITYRTLDFESINGARSTYPKLTVPLHKCKYSTDIFKTSRHSSFINLFRDGLTAVVIHPIWGQPALITATLTNTTVIPCVNAGIDFKVGMEVFVSFGYNNFNIVSIVSIGANSLVVDEAIDISLGSIVLPSFIGIVSGEINTTYTGENFAMCEINVEEFR